MRPWKDNSLFIEYLNENRSFVSPPLLINDTTDIPKVGDLASLMKIRVALNKIGKLVANRPNETQVLRKIGSLVKSFENKLHIKPWQASFSLFMELREVSFSLPLELLKSVPADPVTMVLLAHIYVVVLSV